MRRRSRQDPEDDAIVFTALYRRHYSAVLAFCVRRSTTEQDALDATAEAFTVAWRRLGDARDPSLPWLLAIARRTLANRRRGGARRDALVERLAGSHLATSSPCPSDAVHDRVTLHDAFALLSDSDRETLALWAWEGLSAGEAAETLGITTTAYGVRLMRARRRLRKHLEAAGEQPAQRPASPMIETGSTHA